MTTIRTFYLYKEAFRIKRQLPSLKNLLKSSRKSAYSIEYTFCNYLNP